MSRTYKIGEFAKMINRKVKTLQKWDREGILPAYRTPTGRRYYTHEQYLEYMGIAEEKSAKHEVIYARVSNRNQKDDLKNQIEFLVRYCEKNAITIHKIYQDYRSGLNYNSKDWNKLLDKCFEGKIKTIVISHEDRFTRFGFDWISDLLKRQCGVDVVVAENVTTSPEADLVKDLISIIHVFSCRIYGLRKYRKKIEKDFKIDG